MDAQDGENGASAGENGSSSRYFCPYPGCKRSFAELWRLKVHYRAPPDIRGSGKERGHGTELTHCPKCGKGLKPGKHHVGCSGGKAGPRQNKRSRLAGPNGMGMDGMQANMYTLQMQYGQAGSAPNGMTPQLGSAGFQQQQQYLAQQYQPDMSGGMYAGAQDMSGSMPQQTQAQQLQQQPPQQQSPALSMGILPDQLTNGGGVGATPMLTSTGGSGEAGMTYYQQQPMQQQVSLESGGMPSLQPMQSGQLQDGMVQHAAQHAAAFGMTASAAFIHGQAQGQPQQQQVQTDAGEHMYLTASGDAAAAAAAAATAGMMLPPQPMQMQQVPAMQQQQGVPQQQPSPQLIPGMSAAMPAATTVITTVQSGPVQLASAGSGAVLLQQPQQHPQQQQLPQLVTVMSNQQQPQQQQLMSPTAVPQQQLQPQGQLQQQQAVPVSIQPTSSGSLQSVATAMQPPAGAGMQQQQQMMQPAHGQQQQQQMMQPAHGQQQQVVMQQAPNMQPVQQQQQMPPPPAIHNNMFDEIDGGFDFTCPPSPPPLPSDFPAAPHTLFNFNQFSQKMPAAAGPSQQMAMMPRGMEQELPPSMDELWTPEATYDHHSDGDLMQLLFGAPEQPPTMATIHLHHFLEEDACSSPGLLAGILGGSMDDLHGAGGGEGGAGEGAAGVGELPSSSAMVAPTMPAAQQLGQGAPDAAAAFMQQPQQGGQQQQQLAAAFVPTAVKAEPQQLGHAPVMVAMQQQPQQMMGSLQPQHLQQQDCGQQPVYQQQMYSTLQVPVNGMNGMNGGLNGMNGMNGLNGLNCVMPGANGMLPPSQCGSAALQVHMSMQLSVQQQEVAAGGAGGGGGMVAIKAEDDQALLMVSSPHYPAAAR